MSSANTKKKPKKDPPLGPDEAYVVRLSDGTFLGKINGVPLKTFDIWRGIYKNRESAQRIMECHCCEEDDSDPARTFFDISLLNEDLSGDGNSGLTMEIVKIKLSYVEVKS